MLSDTELTPDTAASERTDWDDVLEAERPTATATFGTKVFQLRTPATPGAIDRCYDTQARLSKLAEAWSTNLELPISVETLVAARVIRACLESPPDLSILLKLAHRQPGFFAKLNRLAMGLCGMLDDAAALAEAQGNAHDDQ